MQRALAGKRALVTGGSRGIGLGIASALAAAGASCTLVGRREPALADAVRQLGAAQEHGYLVGDVSSESLWQSQNFAFEILVNAAGVTHFSLLSQTPRDTIEAVVATNLLGTIFACRAVSKSMLALRSGCIINISSALAHRFGAGSSIYAASKAGVIGFTKALAYELGPRNIRVNAIAPGYIDTDMLTATLKKTATNKISLNRLGRSEEVADAAMFLTTCQYMNGSTITIDGGTVYE